MTANDKFAQLRGAIEEYVDNHRDAIVTSLHHLFDHPELSGEEVESAKWLVSQAREGGLTDTVIEGIGSLPTAYQCTRDSGAPGPHIAFLSEYDALPGVGHGCGHNMIGTVGVFTARALASVLPQVGRGKVSNIGTPAEETFGGKITMLHEGAFKGVDAALMMHPGLYTEFDYKTLACTTPDIEFFGKSSHAASCPWNGVNALDAMIQLFVMVDAMKKQLPLSTRCPGVILNGGERANMVPDYTRAHFSVRGATKDEMFMVQEKLINCANAAALATGCKVKVTEDPNAYYDLCADKQLAGWYQELWSELGGEPPMDHPVPHGSVDIGNLSYAFPCLHVNIRISPTTAMAGHSVEFGECTLTPFAEEQMLRTIKTLALTGLKRLLAE